MALNYQSIVLLAALTIASCGLSESRGIWASERVGDVDTSLLTNPQVRRVVLSAILRSQGTSQDQIQQIIDGADGDLQQIVDGINSALKEEVVRLDEGIKINPEGLKKLLQKSIPAILPKSPLSSAIESSISEQIARDSAQFRAAITRSAIPADVAQQLARRKRSLEPRDLVSDITGIVSNIVLGIVGDQVSAVVSGILDTVKQVIGGFLIVNATGNPIADFLAGIVNFVVTGLLQLITIIQQNISPSVGPQVAPLDLEFRQKRDIWDDIGNGIGDIVNGIVGGTGDAVGGVVNDTENGVQDVTNSGSGLLDGILAPIFNLLADLLSPVNAFLKAIVNAVGGLLQSLLGSTLVTPLQNVLLAIIDVFIPSNPSF